MEMIDLYDINMRKTGIVAPRYGAKPEGTFAIHVHVVLMHTDGRFLLQMRARDKKVSPGVWDITGGGTCAGEMPRETAIRETMEEMALDLTGAHMELGWQKTNLTPWRHHLVVWGAVCPIDVDALEFDPREAEGAKLVDMDEYVDAVCWNKDEEYRLHLIAFCKTLRALAQ